MIMTRHNAGMALLLGALALGPMLADAQTVTRDKPYVPKFSRLEKAAEWLNLHTCGPEYPRSAARNEEEGETTVSVTIDSKGQVLSMLVTKSSGHRALDLATVKGISQCNFRPGLIDGKPVQSINGIAYAWKLE
jgi:protein TonB